jgi:hypothetical protein
MGNPLREFTHIEAKTVAEATAAWVRQSLGFALVALTCLNHEFYILVTTGYRSQPQEHFSLPGLHKREGG